jgi:hypothetical protein
LINLEKLFLQVPYDCSSQDKQNLESLQKQIQERINFLNENNLNSYADPELLDQYELYSQIQQCAFQDHTDQYLVIIGVIAGISLLVYLRWKMIKKGEVGRSNQKIK